MNTRTLVKLLHEVQMEIDYSIVQSVDVTGDRANIRLRDNDPAKSRMLLDILDAADDNGSLSVWEVDEGARVQLTLDALVQPYLSGVYVRATYSRRAEPRLVTAIENLINTATPRTVLTSLIELSPPRKP
jgi:hypothetical protein